MENDSFYVFFGTERAEFFTFLLEPEQVMDLKWADLLCSCFTGMAWSSSRLTGTSLRMASGEGITALLHAEQRQPEFSLSIYCLT